MALELARSDPVYEDIASKFFEHFVRWLLFQNDFDWLSIADAMNTIGGSGMVVLPLLVTSVGLWDEESGFYYDQLKTPDGEGILLKIKSIVGIVPFFSVGIFPTSHIEQLKG